MMKYMFFNKKFLFAIGLGLVLGSCSKSYLDINSNPNQPTDQNITPELIFPQAAEAVGAIQGVGPWGVLDSWLGYFASNGDFARDQQETSYNIDFSFSNTPWATYYNALFDLYQTKTKALANGDTALAGASMVLSAKLWQELVDAFGNVPYSDAFSVAQNPHPAYDDAQSIYNSLELSLDTAIQYVQLIPPPSFNYPQADIVNHGDAGKWMKFANILKLRILLRQSEVSGFNPSSELAKINNPVNGGLPGPGDNFSENPGYLNDVNKQNPTFATLGYTSAASPAKQNTATGLNNYILSVLYSGTSTVSSPDFIDPRTYRFWQSVNGAFNGNNYGDDPGNSYSGASTSYFGPGLIGDALNGIYTAGASQDQWLLADYESLFMEAEAAERGWIEGNAQSLFESAITQSFVFLKVPDAESAASSYIENTFFANWQGWQAYKGSTLEDMVDLIAIQMYISNCGIDPFQSWCDERRLHMLELLSDPNTPIGFPIDQGSTYISANPSKISNTIPIRFLYPQTEYTTNGANVNAQGKIDQFSSKIFWMP
jgi:hypothetical protein